jgi:hypothetical protein
MTRLKDAMAASSQLIQMSLVLALEKSGTPLEVTRQQAKETGKDLSGLG